MKKLIGLMALGLLSLMLCFSVSSFASVNGNVSNHTNGVNSNSTMMGASMNGVVRNGVAPGTSTYGTYGASPAQGTYGAASSTSYGTNGVMNNALYRTKAATTTNGSAWGWLGLLGIFGLFGMRSSNREEHRNHNGKM